MKKALQNVELSTLNFLKSHLHQIDRFEQADDIINRLTGIRSFFGNEHDFSVFLDLLMPSHIISEAGERREYGDFQTPATLSDVVCSLLIEEHFNPEILIEPTFGKGSFIISSLKTFPQLKKVYGIEIYEPYCWHTKFRILELFIENPGLNKPAISLFCEDIFKFHFDEIGKFPDKDSVLVIGNPPWVTNAELSSLNSSNLPVKSNFKSYNGMEAITGKGNFDIGEYIILMMLNSFAKHRGYMTMLAKNSVIKNLIHDLPKTSYTISDIAALRFDAKRHFNASVEASLFKCRLGEGSQDLTCKISSLDTPNSVKREFGWVGNKFVSDITLYKNKNIFDGICPLIWRQGVKHDCSKILELQKLDSEYINGFKEQLEIEEDLIFGLVKSSDLQSPLIVKPRKYVIVTQKKIGEETAYLAETLPKLYKYLIENVHFFTERKSTIYKGKPQFSVFGIGDYSFKPYKVAISGLYKKLSFSLILPFNNKPLMLDDTCYFLGFDDIAESLIVFAVLNSTFTRDLLRAITFIDAKRPYTKDILMRIDFLKIASHLGFKKAREILTILPDDISQNLTQKKWDGFFENYRKEQEEHYQYALFEPYFPISACDRWNIDS
jgi:hypothetical protein